MFMKRLVFLLIPILTPIFLFSFLKFVAAYSTIPSTQTAKQKGMSYATWWSGNYSSPDADLALERLADTGANWISLIVTQYQEDISSTAIYTTTATPTDTDLIHAIEKAHDLGIQVMLKPHVDLWDDPSHWRGQIGIGFSGSDWTAWFSSYQTFILHYAQLAQTHNVEQFSVGCELSGTEHRETAWRSVISEIRLVFSGPLTYAANHGDETSLPWWDALDLIGVDAYYPLTNKNNPTVAELKTAWSPYITTLAALSVSQNKPIIFTEIGYRSQDGTNQHPWDWQVSGTVDLQEQADAYQAVFESIFDQPWFDGIFWWSWDTDPYQGGPCDDGYSIYDKPAEDILRSWYGAPLRVRLPDYQPEPDYDNTLKIYTDELQSGWENWSWDSTINFSANIPVYSGTHSISVAAQPWGALSLHHENFDSSPYYWIEFFIRKSSSDQVLMVNIYDENDEELRYRPVDDCRYTEGVVIDPELWTRIQIPLSHLDATDRLLQRFVISNYQDDPSNFWVDEVRFVGGMWSIYLPSLMAR